MNLWGTGPFDNDVAQTFAGEVVQDGDYALAEAFDVVLDPDLDFVEAEEGFRVTAAAEVLTAVLTGDTARLTDAGLRRWVGQASAATLEPLRTSARTALKRVLGSESELPDLWEDEKDAQEWRLETERLLAALDLSYGFEK